jgi:hypothetical protein
MKLNVFIKKRAAIFAILLGFCSSVYSQGNTEGAKVVTVSQVVNGTVNSNQYSIQVGLPYLGITESSERTTTPLDIRFPWDILYFYDTFSEESFTVSKGYFTDKVRINWAIRANQDLILGFYIHRRELGESNYTRIASLSSFTTEYEDKYIEGAALYEYKVEALGVSETPEKYQTFIEGIGFRSPSGIVTGRVTYEGGNPVKDAVISASSDTGTPYSSSGIHIQDNSSLKINRLKEGIENHITLQAWVMPKPLNYVTDLNDEVTVFSLKNLTGDIEAKVNVRLEGEEGDSFIFSDNYLEVDIAGSVFRLHNFYPSGSLNSRGDDVLIDVLSFHDHFTHFTVTMVDGDTPILYINGRKIDQTYVDKVNAALTVGEAGYDSGSTDPWYPDLIFSVDVPNTTIDFDSWREIQFGSKDSTPIYIDEIRVWNSALPETDVYKDYKRIIDGNDINLISYLRMDEAAGNVAYDMSHVGFNYNNNNAAVYTAEETEPTAPVWVSGENTPSSTQLGVLGITDDNGNYIISAIPYSGVGETYAITPMLGVHEFDPGQQLIFIGETTSVTNNVNFIDKSSFIFKGKVRYDSRGVFKSFVEVDQEKEEDNQGNEYIPITGVIQEGYNFYKVGGDVAYQKGRYWFNDNGTPDDDNDNYLEEYVNIPSEGVNIYIDNQIVLDANNEPIVSNSEGEFIIKVPIGNHFISIRKNGHEFAYSGRFPADDTTDDDNLEEFFQDSEEFVTFIDQTKVTVVGRVVGGAVESAKTIGFGDIESVERILTDSNGFQLPPEVVTSVNNIGKAAISFGYTPTGSNNGPQPQTRAIDTTNIFTGEYRKILLPLQYSLSTDDVRIMSNPNLEIIASSKTELADFSIIETPKIPSYEYADGQTITGRPYTHNRNFNYVSDPILRVLEQTAETELEKADGTTISLDDVKLTSDSQEDESVLIYRQFQTYSIQMKRYQEYINNDADIDDDIDDILYFEVPITDGELAITNNLALDDSGSILVSERDPSIINYTFRAGEPVINQNTQTINIEYRVNNSGTNANGYIGKGIILGGISNDNQEFITWAPETPAIILRDPPGSNSYATIHKGETFSFTSEANLTNFDNTSLDRANSLGASFGAGGGLAGPVISGAAVNVFNNSISKTTSSSDGTSLTETYTFTQSISTSSEPNMVGADADVYIGNSFNINMGFYWNVDMRASATSNVFIDGVAQTENNMRLTTSTSGESDVEFFIGKQKALSVIKDESEATAFTYTQFHILNTLIPLYESLIADINNGVISPNPEEKIYTVPQYEEQIKLWRTVIKENEEVKYRALNFRTSYLEELLTNVDIEINGLVAALEDLRETFLYNIGAADEEELILTNNLSSARSKRELINARFADNFSLDSGVGEVSRSIETAIVNSSSTSFNLSSVIALSNELGADLQGIGMVITTGSYDGYDRNISSTSEQTTTQSISYTLADSDPGNYFSVDVVNSFDGNGPVFITKGGSTSCPYEAAEKSLFYSFSNDDPNVLPLGENQQEDLSIATQQIEQPQITTDKNIENNVPSYAAAEFRVRLENLSTSDVQSDYVLRVNQETNPNGAIINVSEGILFPALRNGVITEFVVTIEKSSLDSDNDTYEDIEIIFESNCDSNISDSVILSAYFVPACSNVVVSAPLDNWVYNTSQGNNPLAIQLSEYNTDFSGLEKIDLEFRQSSSSTWTRLQTYYATQPLLDAANVMGETQIDLIGEEGTINYAWDIEGQNIQNGSYEIRAISYCENGTSTTSEVISGKIDLSRPIAFGTPTPIDGILGIGEDLSMRFNEAIYYTSGYSIIEITGETNQLEIDNNVSLSFNGPSNTVTIENPYIQTGSFSFEFWMNTGNTPNPGTIVAQEGGINIDLVSNGIRFQFGEYTVSKDFTHDDQFHHYTFTYDSADGSMNIYRDATSTTYEEAAPPNVQYNFDADMVFGGDTFRGNLHDVRLWSKALSSSNAYANMRTKYLGNELGLVGYWPMNEGHGDIAYDKARFKHAQVNTTWTIKPKGEAYEFSDNQYLTLDAVGSVQLTKEMDATLSFWVKTDQTQNATIFSNGRGDNTDEAVNGIRKKWAVNLNSNGILSFESNNNSYNLTTTSITDGQWHHVSILINRLGNLKTYLDADLVSTHPVSDISAFSGSKIWLGARGQTGQGGEIVDREFSGSIDELRLWNTVRSFEQIERDRYFEVDLDSPGLMLYARMNAPITPNSSDGPIYTRTIGNSNAEDTSKIGGPGEANYDDMGPAVKPARNTINFQVSHVINGDQIIMEPVVSSLAVIEGQVLDITVDRMFDASGNQQASPITWTAYYNKNQVDWYIDGAKTVSEAEMIFGDEKTYTILVVNSGGTTQDFSLLNVPSWLTLSESSGVLAPNSSIEISATVDSNLAAGDYEQDLFLSTEFGYDQKIQLKLNIFSDIDWTLDPNDFQYSMNIIGQINIDNVLAEDLKDKVGVFYNDELRGVAQVIYDANYGYLVYLTVYSNTASGEILNFNIWDSSEDKILVATLNENITTEFVLNQVLGSNATPATFENTGGISQSIPLNQGYTWISFPLESASFSSVNATTANLDLETNDLILSHSPSLLETYFNDPQDANNSSWSGSISSNGGFSTSKMYKVRLANAQTLDVSGTPVDISTWTFPIRENWNWLPYVIGKSARVAEALSNFNAQVNDVIKSQNEFAIYDQFYGWTGTLSYLEKGKGYMLKSSSEMEEFKYPNYLSRGKRKKAVVSTSAKSSSDTQSAFNGFSQNMNAVIQLPYGYTNVYAYNTAGELHGHSVTQMVNDKELSFMTIVGDTSQNQLLVFHIGDGDTTKRTSKTINFGADSILGTTRDPYIIDQDDIDLSNAQFLFYPNPSKDGFVYLDFSAQNEQITQVRIHNMLNQLLLDMPVEIKKGRNLIKIPVNFANGTYLLTTTIDNEIHYNKLILDGK